MGHRTRRQRSLCERRIGCARHDGNPIEQVFAKLKHLIRAAEPRDIEATWRKVGELHDLFSEKECANYFKNSGYVSA